MPAAARGPPPRGLSPEARPTFIRGVNGQTFTRCPLMRIVPSIIFGDAGGLSAPTPRPKEHQERDPEANAPKQKAGPGWRTLVQKHGAVT